LNTRGFKVTLFFDADISETVRDVDIVLMEYQ